MAKIKLIVGLGNPGKKYELTRHNIGFKTVDCIAEKWQASWKNWKDLAKISIQSQSNVILAKPQTYMNNSGIAVRSLLDYYDLNIENLLVVVDDFSIPLSNFKLKKSGSSGGHNGLASIIENTGSSDFSRIRVGIGPLKENSDSVNFVLSEFSVSEIQTVNEVINKAADIVNNVLQHGWEKAASQLPKRNLSETEKK